MMDKSRYPDNWNDISRRIRFERAGGRCEQCGVQHGTEIIRSSENRADYIVWDNDKLGYRQPNGSPIRLSEIPEQYDITGKHTKVILTVHHIGIDHEDGTPGDPHDKMDCRETNLIALCQRCHLIADKQVHIENARVTRLNKKAVAIEQTGQLALFEVNHDTPQS